MRQLRGKPFSGFIPKLKVRLEIDEFLTFSIRHGEAAAGANRNERGADFRSGLFHRTTDLSEVLKVGAGADVHMKAGNRQVVLCRKLLAFAELLVPDSVL